MDTQLIPRLRMLLAEIERTPHGAQPWRVDQYKESLYFIEAGPADDLRDCYDLLEDPPKCVLELLVLARDELPALLTELERLYAGILCLQQLPLGTSPQGSGCPDDAP